MLHSHKEHLEAGKIVMNSKGVIGFKPRKTGKATSFCKRASSNLNNFSTFSDYTKKGDVCCSTCEKAYKELVTEVKRFRKIKSEQ
tara:strand:- start:73 stop:327 length:255 start_codon:yes stop_codon:yes gene_type:complete